MYIYNGETPIKIYKGNHGIPKIYRGDNLLCDEMTNLPPWAKLTNRVLNGDFSDGTTGWTATTSTLSASDNTLFATATGQSANGNLYGAISANIPVGRRFYQRAMIRLDSALCASISIYTGASYPAIYSSPPANTWIPASTIATTGRTLTTTRWYHNYGSEEVAAGKVMSMKSVLLIDLTDLEAALGREVTVEEMDTYMSQFDNDWFSGPKMW